MSTVQLPKLADRCPAWAHDLVGLLRRLWRYRGSASLLYEAANQAGLERCFECIPARSVPHDEHCVPSALVSAREVRLIREPSGQ